MKIIQNTLKVEKKSQISIKRFRSTGLKKIGLVGFPETRPLFLPIWYIITTNKKCCLREMSWSWLGQNVNSVFCVILQVFFHSLIRLGHYIQ